MSQFLTSLEVTLLEDASNDYRGTWRLDSPLLYQSDTVAQIITVPVGFITDFESCPRLPIVFWLAGEIVHEAAVVHDFLYKTKLLPRGLADAVLREASAVTGVPAWRGWLMWAGVRVGGASHFGT